MILPIIVTVAALIVFDRIAVRNYRRRIARMKDIVEQRRVFKSKVR